MKICGETFSSATSASLNLSGGYWNTSRDQITWTASPSGMNFTTASGSTYVFNPSECTPGEYTVKAQSKLSGAYDTCVVRIVDVEILMAYSDQLSNRTANPLPTLNGQNTMYMGARSDNKGYLQVEVIVMPSVCTDHVLVGVRKMGTTTILASTPAQNGGKTPISFNNAGGFERYEVVAGVDVNEDGTLQNSEVIKVMPNQFVLVTQSDYDDADDVLLAGTGVPLGIARDLLTTFRNGTVPPSVVYVK